MLITLLSLPAYFLGLYLAIILNTQALERRVPEIGRTKKQRSAEPTISAMLFCENRICGRNWGWIRGTLVVLQQVTLSQWLFLQSYFPAFLQANVVHLSATSLSLALVLGIGGCILASINPIRKLNKITILDSTKDYINYNASQPWRSGLGFHCPCGGDRTDYLGSHIHEHHDPDIPSLLPNVGKHSIPHHGRFGL